MITEEQLKIHNRCITGSKIAAILNISPYQSKYELFAQMKGLLPPVMATQQMIAGNYMETAIANFAHVEWGWMLKNGPNEGRLHPDYDFLYSLVDRIKFMPDKTMTDVVEIKNVGWYKKSDWVDDIPDYVKTQLYFYMLIYGLPGKCIACFGGNEIVPFTLERNETIEKFILDEALQFWDDLRNDNWPDPGGTPGATLALKSLFPHSILPTIQGDEQLLQTLRERERWDKKEKIATEKKIAAENRIKAYMQGYEKMALPDGSYVTWKQTKDQNFFDLDRLKNEEPVIYKKFTSQKPGARRFYTKYKGDINDGE